MRYAYDLSNEVTSLTDWAGDTLTFTYNGAGQECWVSTYAPSTPSCTSVPYQASAVTTAYSYDAVGNLSDSKTTTGTGPANLLDLSVGTRNADNFITAETPTIGSTADATDSYGYNSANEVASGPIAGTGSNSYAYTSAGSITTDTTAFASAAYTGAGALCWTSPSTSANGCSSPPSGATTYTYNADGQRTSATPPSGNPQSYGWDTASGLLTCANTNGTTCSTSSPTASTTVYAYGGDGLRASATIGSTTTDFTWGTLGGSSSLLSDGTWDFVYVPGSPSPLEQISASGSSPTVDLLVSDEVGNTRGLVQLSSGTHADQLVNYTDYDAYGNPITQSGSGGTAETGGLTIRQTSLNANYVGTTPWGYGYGYTDPTGIVYLVHRYYDPASGQFISIDPLVSTTQQAYQYAGDNPTENSDPSGLAFDKRVSAIGNCGVSWLRGYWVPGWHNIQITMGFYRLCFSAFAVSWAVFITTSRYKDIAGNVSIQDGVNLWKVEMWFPHHGKDLYDVWGVMEAQGFWPWDDAWSPVLHLPFFLPE